MTLSCNGESRRFYGTVVTISADNLSAHSLIATKDEITTKFKEEDFTLRNSTNYRYHLQAVRENPDYRSVYIGLFPPDVMHDVLEGVIPNVLRRILHQLIQDKHFTLVQLNFEIGNLLYSVNDKTSKPQILTERMLRSRGQLSGKASETGTLFRLLPQMVGSYVPPNKYWNCYILL